MTVWQPIDTAPPTPELGDAHLVESAPFLVLFNDVAGGQTVYRARHVAVWDSEEFGPVKTRPNGRGEDVEYRDRRPIVTRRYMFAGGGSVEEGNSNLVGWQPEPAWMQGVRINIR